MLQPKSQQDQPVPSVGLVNDWECSRSREIVQTSWEQSCNLHTATKDERVTMQYCKAFKHRPDLQHLDAVRFLVACDCKSPGVCGPAREKSARNPSPMHDRCGLRSLHHIYQRDGATIRPQL